MFVLLLGLSGYSISNADSINNYGSHSIGFAFAQSLDNSTDSEDADDDESEDTDSGEEEIGDDESEDTDSGEEEIGDDESEDTDSEEEDGKETGIDVELKNGKAKITIEVEDEKSKFLLDTTDENEIISAIVDKTGLTESEIKDIWNFETEDEDSDVNDSIQTDKEDARQDAQDRISELEQKISQLEQRIQSLLQKLETGEYFGRAGNTEATAKSFNISFDGSATSMDDATTTDLSGEIFVESLSKSNNVSTFRVTGGELFVGDELYDVVFGKMRIVLPNDLNANDTILLISEVIDEQGNITTLRLSLTSDVSLDGDFAESVNLKMLSPQSKIAGQWLLDASTQMTSLSS